MVNAKTRKYRSLAIFLAGSLLVVSQAPAQADKRPEKITLTYLSSQNWVKQSEQDLGKRFERETGIKVDYQIIPSEQYQNLLRVKLYTTEMPDIFGSQSGKFDIVSLLDIEKNGVDLSGEDWVKRADPLAIEQVSVKGRVFGLPLVDSSSSWVIVYQKKIFKDLNLSIPTTYAQFKELCAKISKMGTIPLYECLSDGWHHVLWFPELGGRYEQASPGLADRLNKNDVLMAQNKTMTTVLAQLKELFGLGYFGNDSASNTYADTEKNMASGKYAMTVGNFSLPSRIEAAYPGKGDENFGFFVIPLADNQVLNVNPNMPSKFIYAKSKNVEAAKKYLAFLARPENLQYMVDHQPDFMTLPYSRIASKYSADVTEVFARYPARGTVYQAQVKYLTPQWNDIGNDIAAMISDTLAPAEVLAKIDRRRSDMAKAARDPAWTR